MTTYATSIRDLTLTDPLDDQIVWDANSEIHVSDSGGSDDGKLAIRLNVDGQMDIVHAQLGGSDHIDAIDKAIRALTEVRNALTTISTVMPDRRGMCLRWDDHRCTRPAGHLVDECEFGGTR